MYKSIKFFLILLSIFLVCCTKSEEYKFNLLPKPQNLEVIDGYFSANNVSVKSDFNESDEFVNNFLQEYDITNSDASRKSLNIFMVSEIHGLDLNTNEAYTLKVSKDSISISAIKIEGVFRAIQTLRQLATKSENGFSVKCCKIVDYPAFRIRGFMQDVGRSYISVEELKREIDILSKYKINTFHFHLTENQAWRLESKVFPQLNDSVNMTRMKGKFYTHREAKELAEYCRERFITLIPEIDMPGHSAAFERTFGCDMQSKRGTEILILFPIWLNLLGQKVKKQ